ncbi:thermonuclease family protein [Pseudomonas sp. NY15181]|uniref:thermonuclease family protein n=1 Tax=Pseudomonas sp. NY15181 TaxID=3400349 RepID=UPI003A85CF8F
MRRIPALLLMTLSCAALAQEDCRITAVHSGDRLSCQTSGGAPLTIRLRGIDAPTPDQPFGERARETLQRLTLGKTANLRAAQREVDGSLRAAVWVEPADCPGCGQTLDAGRVLLSVGLAHWRQTDEQTAEEKGQYEFEEQEARARRIGLWRAR